MVGINIFDCVFWEIHIIRTMIIKAINSAFDTHLLEACGFAIAGEGIMNIGNSVDI